MKYPLQDMATDSLSKLRQKQHRRRWLWLLVLPYLGLCFPVVYARSAPSLWGFPFFYWYQLAWVAGASVLLGIVYRKLRT